MVAFSVLSTREDDLSGNVSTTTICRLQVLVRRYLNGTHAVWWGARCRGRNSPTGQLLTSATA
jgi:hypothetical protein